MIVQKKGFLLFVSSLIPGAGELYMGFKKRGINIMLICCGILAFMTITGLEWIGLLLPIIWAYSFFEVHNLKSMPEEIFYMQKDEYIFELDSVFGDKKDIFKKYRLLVAGILIVIGISILIRTFGSLLYYFFPSYLAEMFSVIGGMAGNILAAIIFLGGGAYLAFHKEKKENEQSE